MPDLDDEAKIVLGNIAAKLGLDPNTLKTTQSVEGDGTIVDTVELPIDNDLSMEEVKRLVSEALEIAKNKNPKQMEADFEKYPKLIDGPELAAIRAEYADRIAKFGQDIIQDADNTVDYIVHVKTNIVNENNFNLARFYTVLGLGMERMGELFYTLQDWRSVVNVRGKMRGIL